MRNYDAIFHEKNRGWEKNKGMLYLWLLMPLNLFKNLDIFCACLASIHILIVNVIILFNELSYRKFVHTRTAALKLRSRIRDDMKIMNRV